MGLGVVPTVVGLLAALVVVGLALVRDNKGFILATNRFNVSVVGPHFINPCCFGEDLARWLRSSLRERGIETDQERQEDWGWYFYARFEGRRYRIDVAHGTPLGVAPKQQEPAEWHLTLSRRRSLLEKILRRNKVNASESFAIVLEQVLKGETDFRIQPS